MDSYNNASSNTYPVIYSNYISKHQRYVKDAYRRLQPYLDSIFSGREDIIYKGFSPVVDMETRIKNHDASKYSEEEFMPYMHKFYPDSSILDEETIEADFEKAWKHHYTNNDHHPQFWVRNGSIFKMSNNAMKEMLCDWAAMSRAKDDSTFNWWFYNKEGRCEKLSLFRPEDLEIIDKFIIIYKDII